MPGPASSRAALDALHGAFRRAWEEHPAHRHRADLLLGGFTVRLAMVGDALWERLGPALSHLEGPGAEGVPDLEVTLWDEGATGVPGPFVSLADVLPSGRPFGFGLLGEDRSEAVAGYQTEASCTLLDRRAGRIAGWVHEPAELSDYETGKPLQPLLFAWAQDRDLLPVHAALVAQGGRGVLLGGHGGSGKSTSALSCLRAGFDYLGDDYIGVAAPEGSRFLGHSFYSTSWLEPAHATRFPWLGAAFEDAEPPRGDKRLIRLGTLFPERMARSAPIDVLALPRVGDGGPTRARRIRPAEAVRRLAPSSILQLPFSDPGRLLDRMAELAHAVPCYQLELGDPAGIPSCLGCLLDEVEAS